MEHAQKRVALIRQPRNGRESVCVSEAKATRQNPTRRPKTVQRKIRREQARETPRRQTADPVAGTRGAHGGGAKGYPPCALLPWTPSNFSAKLRIGEDWAKLDFRLARTACFDWSGPIRSARRRGVAFLASSRQRSRGRAADEEWHLQKNLNREGARAEESCFDQATAQRS